MPARHMSLSLGARDVSYLRSGEMEVTVSYRFLHSENIFTGTERVNDFETLFFEN